MRLGGKPVHVSCITDDIMLSVLTIVVECKAL